MMNRTHRTVLGFGCLAAWMAGCDADTRIAEGVGEVGHAMLTAESYPCLLQFEGTGVVLRPDLEGAHPDPGSQVAAGPEGTFYTADPQGGQILVWSDQGEFVRSIGRPGQGPGELGTGLIPMSDADGVLHVLDRSMGRWTRFTPQGSLLSTSPRSPHIGSASSISSAFIGKDSLLIGSPPYLAEHQFHVVDADGVVLYAFGGPPAAEGSRQRAIAVTENRTFWAAPRDRTPEYVLEEWTFDGTLVRRLERRVGWFAAIADRPPVVAAEGPPSWPIAIRPYPGLDGKLVVAIINIGLDGPGDVWYEVIDPERSEVLASRHMSIGDGIPPTFNLARGTDLGRQLTTDEVGLRTVEILRYRIEPAGGVADAGGACS